MATPVPDGWLTAPLPVAEPLTDSPPDPTPGCSAIGCTAVPLVQWQRRSATDPTSVEAVFGCGPHAITLDLAALVHAPTCTAPNPVNLPGCDCTPEPAPPPEPMLGAAQPLPDHWT